MMKVLILANNDAGLYNFRKELVAELLKMCEVSLCLPEGDYRRYFEESGCKYIPVVLERHGTNPWKEWKLLRTYKRVLKQEKPDIVFTYTIKPNVYGGMACKELNIPYVVNITGLGTAVENGGVMQKITLALYKAALEKSQKVFFQNTANRDFMLKSGIIKGEYDLLPGSGVNLEQYRVLEYPAGETVDFVFIGRVMKKKGIDQYMDAAKKIREKYPETRFHVCGSCEEDYKDTLDRLQEQGVLIYHGSVTDMAEIYRMASCTVHPTYYPEGLSNVLLESCACGRPIITTGRPGCREVVDDEVNGFVVEEKNSKDLIEKIEKFLAISPEERKQMGLAGRRKVEREFNRQIVVDKYLEELNNV